MRGVLITIILAICLAGTAAWGLELWQPTPDNLLPNLLPENKDLPSNEKSSAKDKVKLGEHLYVVLKGYAPSNNRVLSKYLLAPDAVVIPACRLVITQKQTVSAAQDGMVLFIGTDTVGGVRTEIYKVSSTMGDEYVYHPWHKGKLVQPREMVAMMDPSMVKSELSKTRMQILMAQQETLSAKAIHGESKKQLQRVERMLAISATSVGKEEHGIKILQRDRAKYDMEAKKKAVEVAKNEAKKMQLMLQKHEIRNMMKGVGIITEIYKRRGEAVKAQEPILELVNVEMLRAEGFVEAQYLKQLRDLGGDKNPKVRVEPVYDQAPWRVLEGHRAAVNSVAFSHHAPWIVSGSDDHSALVWSQMHKTALWKLDHPAPVKVVTCTPKAAKHNLCLIGCDDGSIHLWDLSELNLKDPTPSAKLLRWQKQGQHSTGGVTALAFSPDGKYFASGGEDRGIVIWDTEKGEPLYTFDDATVHGDLHEGPITSLHFTTIATQDKDTAKTKWLPVLVSASRDKTLRVWQLHKNGVKMQYKIKGRGGSVVHLGVSPNGRYMLYDQGQRLQLISVADGKTMSQLSSPANATAFETLALFSPNASLILTGGAPNGRLQLWQTPNDGGRGIELREWVTKEGSPVNCAAFSTEAGMNERGYAASGCKNGNVYLWRVPSQKDIDNHTLRDNLKLDMVDRSLGAGNQVRIGVNVRNPDGKLMPGATVTIVIEP